MLNCSLKFFKKDTLVEKNVYLQINWQYRSSFNIFNHIKTYWGKTPEIPPKLVLYKKTLIVIFALFSGFIKISFLQISDK